MPFYSEGNSKSLRDAYVFHSGTDSIVCFKIFPDMTTIYEHLFEAGLKMVELL